MIARFKWYASISSIVALYVFLSSTAVLAEEVPEENKGLNPSVSVDAEQKNESADNYSLEGLMGVSEISVRADAEGDVGRWMAEYQVLEVEPAQPVEEANLQDSIAAGRGFSRRITSYNVCYTKLLRRGSRGRSPDS